MSDQQVGGFDDWQAEADIALQQKKQEALKEPQVVEEKPVQVKEVEQEKPKVDPHQLLLSKIKQYKNLDDNSFDKLFKETKSNSSNDSLKDIKTNTQILKNQKDFAAFGRAAGKRFNDLAQAQNLDALQRDDILAFFQETLLLFYSQLEWKNMHQIKKKLTVVKNLRKEQQVKQAKIKKKQQVLKRQGGAAQKSEKKIQASQKTNVQDDLFDGQLMTSKKEQDDRKKKQVKEAPPAPVQNNDDDDDFM